jgi:hypothetical protein
MRARGSRDRLFRVVQLLSALDGVDERTCAELAEGNLRDLRDALAAVQHVSGTADRTVATVSSVVTALFGSPGSGLAVAVGRVPAAQPNSPMADLHGAVRALKMKDLKRCARALGVTAESLDGAEDDDDPKAAIQRLLVASAERLQQDLKPRALKAQATQLGVGADALDECFDAQDPKLAMVLLMLAAAAAGGAAPEAAPSPLPEGVPPPAAAATSAGYGRRVAKLRTAAKIATLGLGVKKQYHAFLTHDWGQDGSGRPNHERVSRINAMLKQRGIVTWMDEERMEGNIVSQMCAGIDDSSTCVVFITHNYLEKVGGENMADNCKKEFLYADRRKTAKLMIPVVMEEDGGAHAHVRDPSSWRGPVGMSLGGQLYVDMSGDVNSPPFQEKVDELVANIQRLTEAQPMPQQEPETQAQAPTAAGTAAPPPPVPEPELEPEPSRDPDTQDEGAAAGRRLEQKGAAPMFDSQMAFFSGGAAESGAMDTAAADAPAAAATAGGGAAGSRSSHKSPQKATSVRELDSAAMMFFNTAGQADGGLDSAEAAGVARVMAGLDGEGGLLGVQVDLDAGDDSDDSSNSGGGSSDGREGHGEMSEDDEVDEDEQTAREQAAARGDDSGASASYSRMRMASLEIFTAAGKADDGGSSSDRGSSGTGGTGGGGGAAAAHSHGMAVQELEEEDDDDDAGREDDEDEVDEEEEQAAAAAAGAAAASAAAAVGGGGAAGRSVGDGTLSVTSSVFAGAGGAVA